MLIFLLFSLLLPAMAGPPDSHTVRLPEGEKIRGGALISGSREFFTWGDRLRLWRSGRQPESTVVAQGPFGEGGCVADLDGDGQMEFIGVRGEGLGDLLWFGPSGSVPERIDDQMEAHDCLAATLFGRKGVLVIQRGMQIRFYERVRPGAWRSRDIYSIYTPSYQTGLALADVDRDGRVDILCGNYWVQSPGRWEESWRIFAINTWSEQQESAMFRIAALPDGSAEFVAQGHSAPARFARFDRPSNPRLQWPVTALTAGLTLANVHGLALWNGWVLAGENNGPASRLFLADPAGRSETRIIRSGQPVVAILPTGQEEFVTLGPNGVTFWRYSPATAPPRR